MLPGTRSLGSIRAGAGAAHCTLPDTLHPVPFTWPYWPEQLAVRQVPHLLWCRPLQWFGLDMCTTLGQTLVRVASHQRTTSCIT